MADMASSIEQMRGIPVGGDLLTEVRLEENVRPAAVQARDVQTQAVGNGAAEPAGAGKPQQVGSEQAEAFISEKRIGERIKHLRLKKGMGLVELGRHTGLSASFLSQLETGRVVPTLRNLARVAMVFSKDLSYFFEPEPQMLFRVHRASERARLPQSGVEEPTYFFESLGFLTPERSLDPYFAEFLPLKAGREGKVHQHPGNEFVYLISGELDMRHGEETYRMAAGDGVYFDAATSHGYQCVGNEPATAVIVILQSQAGEGSRRLMRVPSPAMPRLRTMARPETASVPGTHGHVREPQAS